MKACAQKRSARPFKRIDKEGEASEIADENYYTKAVSKYEIPQLRDEIPQNAQNTAEHIIQQHHKTQQTAICDS